MNKKIGSTILVLALAVGLISANSVFSAKLSAPKYNNITADSVQSSAYDSKDPSAASGTAMKEGEAIEAASKIIKEKYGISALDMKAIAAACKLDNDPENYWYVSFQPKETEDNVSMTGTKVALSVASGIVEEGTIVNVDGQDCIITKDGAFINVNGQQCTIATQVDVYSVYINAKTGEAKNIGKDSMGAIKKVYIKTSKP